MPEKRVTMKDIAKKAGVSVMTVSYALRDSPSVSAATRERIHEIGKKMGYAPDPVLSRLSSYRRRQQETQTGTVLAWLNLHPFERSWNFRGSHFLESFEGAKRRAAELGYRLDSFCVPELGGWRRIDGILRSRGVEGVIIGQPPPEKREIHLDWQNYAIVAIGRAIQSPELPRVVLNHVEAVTRLTEQLKALGYNRIGLVMEAEDCAKNAYRNIGAYFGACEKLGLPEGERIPPLTPRVLSVHNLGEWIRKWQVEAILVHRPDQMPRLLPKLGLRVPEDIGYAHLSMHERSDYLSGLFFAPGHLGSWAVDLCHWTLDREGKGLQDPTPSLVLTACEWVPGQTVRASGG